MKRYPSHMETYPLPQCPKETDLIMEQIRQVWWWLSLKRSDCHVLTAIYGSLLTHALAVSHYISKNHNFLVTKTYNPVLPSRTCMMGVLTLSDNYLFMHFIDTPITLHTTRCYLLLNINYVWFVTPDSIVTCINI